MKWTGLILLLLLSSLPVLAEDTKKEMEDDFFPIKGMEREQQEYCESLELSIRENLGTLNECLEDKDCVSISLPCPWPAFPCAPVLISQEHKSLSTTVSAQINSFTDKCIEPHPVMKPYCKNFNKELEKKKGLCPHLKLLCINNRCMTQTHAIMQDNAPDERKSPVIGKPAPARKIRKQTND